MPPDTYPTNRSMQPLQIFQVMPREMYFGASRATSIDLCVRELMLASRHRCRTRIFSEEVDDPFCDFPLTALPSPRHARTFNRANFIAAEARRLRPDIIMVQQHLPTAAAIALRVPNAKVILHTHNFQKSYAAGASLRDRLRRNGRKYRYNQLAGLLYVSEACRTAFNNDWPDVSIPDCVVNNGFDFSKWRPAPQRDQSIVYAGRCAPEKGILEMARAVAGLLPHHPGWRARFRLSAVDAHPELFDEIRATLAALGSQAEILVQQPFEEVKALFESAAIAVVPSIYNEAFGRTALEAHAGGAALISSGSGGLAEVSGSAALRLSKVEPDEISRAIQTLIGDEKLRENLARAGAMRVQSRLNISTQAAQFDAFCETIATGNPGRFNRLERGAYAPHKRAA